MFAARAQGNQGQVRKKKLEENFLVLLLPFNALPWHHCHLFLCCERCQDSPGHWWCWVVGLQLMKGLTCCCPWTFTFQSSFSKPSNWIYKLNRKPLSKLLIQNSLNMHLWLEDWYVTVNMILGVQFSLSWGTSSPLSIYKMEGQTRA